MTLSEAYGKANDKNNPIIVSQAGSGVDAFGNQRMTQPTSLFGIQQQYNKQPLFYEEKLANGGTTTHLPNESSVQMNVTTTAGSSVIRQTRQYLRYQTGKSQLPKQTFVFGATTATKEVGWGDAENGIFIKYDGTDTTLILRSFVSGSVVETPVLQEDWSEDKLLGPNDPDSPSGILLDIEKGQIVAPDAEWLGTGNVRVTLNIMGKNEIIHIFEGSNVNDGVYMTTANLPLRWSIVSDGANADSMKHICGSMDSEGGVVEELGVPFAAESLVVSVPLSTEKVVCAIRPRTTFNSITNRTNAILEILEAFALDQSCIARAYYDPVLTNAPSYTNLDTAELTLEFADSVACATTTISSGRAFEVFPLPATQGSGNRPAPVAGTATLLSKLPFCLDIDGANPNTVVITIENLDSTSAVDVWAVIKGKDVY